MSRKAKIRCLAAVLALAPALAQAADGGALFVQKCGSCHRKGGEAVVVNPADKAAIVWQKYFDRGRHPVDLAATMSDDELQAVIGYLKDHAADSDQPAAAIIPR